MNPTYSIIIPHYNIPDLLMRCLKSIPVSEDIQVIVVDDDSPDADTYLESYPELSRPYLDFIRAPKNGGAGYARNIGLDYAKGKWLMFADADDFFVEGMQEMLSPYFDSSFDVIYFRRKVVKSENINCEVEKGIYLKKNIDKYFQTGDEWIIRTGFSPPYAKMVRRDFVVRNRIRFEEVKYSNDCFFSTCIGIYAKTIEVVDKVLYYNTQRSGQITENYCQKPDELRIRSEVHFNIDKFLMQNGMDRGLKKIKGYLKKMLNMDKPLFCYYFHYRLQEVYPSQWAAMKDLFKGSSIKFKLRYVPYVLYQWLLGTIKQNKKNRQDGVL